MFCIMSKKLPKYKEIEQDILSQIQSGRLKPGDQVMTEMELCNTYKVSRMTAHKALESLAVRGVVHRIAGKGTFVNSIHVNKETAQVTSFSSDIRSVGMVPGSILAEYHFCNASDIPDIGHVLELEPDEKIHCICRIRTADGVKVALNYTYIPFRILPSLDLQILKGSIYEYIQRQYDIYPYSRDKTISAVLATPEQKRLLEIGDEALLQISHPGYLSDGRPFEYTITYYIGSRIVYTNHSGQPGEPYQMTFTPERFISSAK